MNKRLLLIQPPDAFLNLAFNNPPLGLAYLAAVAEKNGWQVKITVASTLDLQLSEEQLVKDALCFLPDVIGISIPTFSARISYSLIKRLAPANAFIVVGGTHATILPEEIITHSPCKVVIRGEGEDTFVELLKYCENKEKNLHQILGITFRNEQGQIVHTPQRPLRTEEELDALPFPAKHLFSKNQFSPLNLGNIAASRGCPYTCTFCSRGVFQQSYRQRKVEPVLEEMQELASRYGVRYIWFVDDVFTLNKEWLRSLCEKIIASQLSLSWICSTRVDCINASLLKIMKQAGCVCIKYGVESLNPLSLEKIKKKVLLEEIKKTLQLTRDAGIGMWLNFMLGFPWETLEDIKQQFEFIQEAFPWAVGINNGSLVTPFPSTELYDSYKEKYHFKDWWLNDQFCVSKLHLYQRLLSYNPAIEETTFPLSKEMLREIRKNHLLFNQRQMLDDTLIRETLGIEVPRFSSLFLRRLRAIATRSIKIFFIRFSMILSSIAPDAELKFLVPLYRNLTKSWRKKQD